MADYVIGAGAIGLHTAYYLQKSGRDVVIIDNTIANNNCSFGNAGYLSPSHFTPLASRDLVWQGLKWMFDSKSPFYIKPSLDKDIWQWAWLFWKNSSHSTAQKNASHLFRLLHLSRELTEEIHQELNHTFDLWLNGCLMLYVNEKTGEHEENLALHANKEFGLNVPILSKEQLKSLDPLISESVKGGAYYTFDGHLHPGKMMEALKNTLIQNGAVWKTEEPVIDFEITGDKISKITTNTHRYEVDNVVIAAGSWSSKMTKKLRLNLPLQAGKGYSHTYKNVRHNIQIPAILVDHRVAMTPLGNDLRVGGTMEISGQNLNISPRRIPPIIDAANLYYDDLNLSTPPVDQVWAGLRPVSPDGLPYIGRMPHHRNCFLATGHAMLGISAAAATGMLMSQIMKGQNAAIQMDAFRTDRFN